MPLFFLSRFCNFSRFVFWFPLFSSKLIKEKLACQFFWHWPLEPFDTLWKIINFSEVVENKTNKIISPLCLCIMMSYSHCIIELGFRSYLDSLKMFLINFKSILFKIPQYEIFLSIKSIIFVNESIVNSPLFLFFPFLEYSHSYLIVQYHWIILDNFRVYMLKSSRIIYIILYTLIIYHIHYI